MPRIATYRELFAYTAWARDKVLAAAAPLTDEQLDRPFEMGEGSLRATIRHLYGSERLWYERWQQCAGRDIPFPHARELTTVAEIRAAHTSLAAARDSAVTQLADADLDPVIRYVPPDGDPRAYPLGEILLHVVNHGVHHRAQALNMLRHLGADLPKPGLDYIFMKVQEQQQGAGAAATGAADLVAVRAYYRYSDWARRRVYAAATPLADAPLDRPFEMGRGTLRATLSHMRDAEHWWLQNWTCGPGQPFPTAAERVSVAGLTRLFDETVAQRSDLLAGLGAADLQKPVSAEPRPGLRLTFPLGVTMLQLCMHGTHHRAQALNMLRHVGGDVPGLDYVVMLREQLMAAATRPPERS
ncbi:MAG: DinB family protein [Planctomycetota bacterium]